MDTEVVFVLEGEVETHKEGMVEEGEDFLLTTDILHLLLTNDVSLVQDLHYEGRGVKKKKIRERMWRVKRRRRKEEVEKTESEGEEVEGKRRKSEERKVRREK